MGVMLDALRRLQEVELQIVDIRSQIARNNRRVTRQEASLREAQNALEQQRASVKRAQAQVDELDLELKSRTESVNKLRAHLNTVKTNKEYAAVLSQLNTEKADASKLESRTLELMSTAEVQKTGLKGYEQKMHEEEARLQEARAQLERTKGSFSDRLAALEREREEAAGQVDGATMQLFERVSERYDGEVMARVSRTHPRRDEFICDGCHMSLAAETANALFTRDEVITCRNCGRILYIEKGT